ncbi:tripartite motif-containing protein 2-like [Lytechinus pictus]|uniref:tripartite motif-containing protein 2-like n=1 Tax=Lytechinus pictus TaxID=7653 RepID=UPI0030B9DF35
MVKFVSGKTGYHDEIFNMWNREIQQANKMEGDETHISTAHIDLTPPTSPKPTGDTPPQPTPSTTATPTDVSEKPIDSMESVRNEVREFFRRCREMLDSREQALLQQLSEERKVIKPPLLTKKRKSVKNHTHQLKLNPLGSIEEGSGSDENGSKPLNNKEEEKQNGCEVELNAKDTLKRKRGRKLKTARHVDIKDENGYHPTSNINKFHLSKVDKKEMKQYENAVQNLGLIYVGNADPSKTIAVARPALVCAKCTAKVKAIDKRGKECKQGGDSFTANMQTPDGGSLPCEFFDNDNGTYTITFRPKVAGTHELNILVSGQPIKSSPLQVKVQPVRLQAKSSFVGGPCMFGLDIPNRYRVPFGDKRDESETERACLTPDMMNIFVRNQEGKPVDSSVIGCVCNDREVSTYNVRFLPASPGDYDINVLLKTTGDVIAQQVIPVHEKEQIGRSGSGVGELLNPTDLTITPHGDIFVADTVENSRIQRFSSDGRYLSQFPVDFQEPALIGSDSAHIAAVFLSSKQVVVYTYDGYPVHQFGHDQLTHPHGIALNSLGNIYIIDLTLQCLLIFTKVGKLLTRLGQEGSRPGEFNHPHFIAIGSDDHIFVSEARNFRIQELSSIGSYVKELRSKDKMAEPGSIAITTGGHLLVHDEKSQKIQIVNLDENRFAGNLPLELIQPNTGRIDVTHDGYIIILDMFHHCLWRYRIPYES